ncbi:MAG TPA: SDR family oxidoreductase [Fimbriimonas sp.]|nr:SDR family oxidoreductase [Fimbriimonas sp.]
MDSLRGEIAFVTGSGRGIGFAIAQRLAQLGADVAIHDRSQTEPAEFGESESLDHAASKIAGAGVRSVAVMGDIADEAAVQTMRSQIENTLGPVSILVNCAGGDIAAKGGKPVPNEALEVPMEDVRAILERNLIGTMIACRAVCPGMIARRKGSIVNIASVAAHAGVTNGVAYATAKAGIVHYSKCLAQQTRSSGVRINVVSPGPIKTSRFMNTRETDPLMVDPEDNTLVRYGEPYEIADVVAFLAGASARFVHGQVIRVDGGWLNS